MSGESMAGFVPLRQVSMDDLRDRARPWKLQQEQVETLQYALLHARTIFGELARADMPEEVIRAVSSLAEIALERIAEGPAEEAVNFALAERRRAEEAGE